MKGFLAKGLLMALAFASSVFAQGGELPSDIPIWDSTYLRVRAEALRYVYPLSMDFNGGGARAKGMGNAFLGISDDVSAVSWNPAGLYRQDDAYSQPVMALGYQSVSSSAAFRDRFYPRDTLKWMQFDLKDDLGGADFMSLLWPIRIKGHMFVGSLAYTRLGDEFYNGGASLDVEMPFDNDDYLAGISRPFHYQVMNAYRSWANAINIGFGTRVYEKLSAGIAINAHAGQAAQKMTETMTWEGLIVSPDGNQRAFAEYINEIYDTTSFSGVYFTLGLKYATPKLSAGLVIKTPHTLKETTDYLFVTTAYINGVQTTEVGAIVHDDNQVVELDQPLVIGSGLGYKIFEQWLVAADVEYRAFGGGKINVRDSLQLVPGGTSLEYFTEYDPQWNDAWVFRVGSEYVWSTGFRLFPTVPLRAGFGYIQIPAPNVEGASLKVVDGVPTYVPVTGQASMTRFSFGTGVRWAQINLDFSFEKSSLDRNDLFIEREQSVDNSALNFTFTGYF
jgi:hypothetical protein